MGKVVKVHRLQAALCPVAIYFDAKFGHGFSSGTPTILIRARRPCSIFPQHLKEPAQVVMYDPGVMAVSQRVKVQHDRLVVHTAHSWVADDDQAPVAPIVDGDEQEVLGEEIHTL